MDVCVQVQRLTYLFTCLTAGRATLASKFEEPRLWTLYILHSNTSSQMESGRLVNRILQFETIQNKDYDIPLPQIHQSKQTTAALPHRNTTKAACCSQPFHWLPEYVNDISPEGYCTYTHYQLQNNTTMFCPQSVFMCFVWCS
jgi:hypothetical protein